MNIEIIRKYCLEKPGVTESFPFDEETLVFKVMGKMFCLTGIDNPISLNLKCDPEHAIELREEYDEVKPGYHMNKTHWNTVSIIGTLPDNMILELIDESYDLVVKGLRKSDKIKLEQIN